MCELAQKLNRKMKQSELTKSVAYFLVLRSKAASCGFYSALLRCLRLQAYSTVCVGVCVCQLVYMSL